MTLTMTKMATIVSVLGVISVIFPLSLVCHIASAVVGYLSVFYPYEGKSVPQAFIFKDPCFKVFFNCALFINGFAAFVLFDEQYLKKYLKNYEWCDCCCHPSPTVATDLARLALCSTLSWLVALMLASNAREDFFNDEDGDKFGNSMRLVIQPDRSKRYLAVHKRFSS